MVRSSTLRQRSRVRHSLHDRAFGTLIETIQRSHVFFAQREVVDIRVTLNSARCVTLWQRNPSLLDTVADENLTRVLLVLFRQRFECLIVSLLVTNKWAIRLDYDLVGIAVVDYLALLAPWVQLKLVSIGHYGFIISSYLNLVDVWRPCAGILFQFLDVAFAKVAHANRSASALLVCFLQCQPHALPCLGACVWAVDKHQIHIAFASWINLFHATNDTIVGFFIIGARTEDFGGNVDI